MKKVTIYFLLSFFVFLFANNALLFAEKTKVVNSLPERDMTQIYSMELCHVQIFSVRTTKLSTSKVKRHGDNIEAKDREEDDDEAYFISYCEDFLFNDFWTSCLMVDHFATLRNNHNDLQKGSLFPLERKKKYLFVCSFKI